MTPSDENLPVGYFKPEPQSIFQTLIERIALLEQRVTELEQRAECKIHLRSVA